MSISKPISVAIIAYGMSGKLFHAPLLAVLPGFRFHSVWRRGEEARQRFPSVRIADSFEDLIGDPEAELVIINTPEPTHYEYARKALEAGKHVVVEKAFTVTSAQANELIALAEARNLCLSVYHNRRWDGNALTVKQILREGHLGRLVEYEARYDRWRPERAATWKETPGDGVSILYNLGSHLIDQVLDLFGMPERVFADIRMQRDGAQTPDNFELLLFYPSLKVSLNASYLMREAAPRYRLQGTEGTYVKFGDDPQEAALLAGALPGGPGWGKEPASQSGILHNGEGRRLFPSLSGNYVAYYEQVYRALREGGAVPVSAREGRNVIRIIELAMQSAAEGRVVEVSET